MTGYCSNPHCDKPGCWRLYPQVKILSRLSAPYQNAGPSLLLCGDCCDQLRAGEAVTLATASRSYRVRAIFDGPHLANMTMTEVQN